MNYVQESLVSTPFQQFEVWKLGQNDLREGEDYSLRDRWIASRKLLTIKSPNIQANCLLLDLRKGLVRG